ncbi:hypothetical protein F5X98DRAFT_370177 [Xylaria grammica]|nr:hypothetical protein F5X98DRAFT_370177 [Xylaria grammica]
MSLYHDYLGDTTVTTDRLEGAYERSGLFRASRPPTPRFEDIAEPLLKRALLRRRLRFACSRGEYAFVSFLVACADGDVTESKALDGILETLSGISAPTTPLPLRILVAVVFIYRNNALVLDLVTWSPPPRRNLFGLNPRHEGSCNTWLWSHRLHSGSVGRKPPSAGEAFQRSDRRVYAYPPVSSEYQTATALPAYRCRKENSPGPASWESLDAGSWKPCDP